MSERSSILSTAELRRPVVTASALTEFARGGLHATTVADVAREAKISPAYVFKLYPSKEQLFVAALEHCFDRVELALAAGADAADDSSPAGLLYSMGDAYASLISDRTLLMIQVHAQSVADIPEIGAALRAGLERITVFAKERTGASDAEVQRFIAYGQLCHLIVTTRIDEPGSESAAIRERAVGSGALDWIGIITEGIRHPGPPESSPAAPGTPAPGYPATITTTG